MQGIIVKGIGGLYYVDVEEKLYECKARGKFRHKGLKPMIGDEVIIEKDGLEGVIVDILPRKNELLRPAVSNVTQAFVVITSKNPDLNLELLYKFLLLCEYNRVNPIICFNKMDLDEENSYVMGKVLERVGYEVLYLKAKAGIGIEALKEKIKDNISVFCGPSGVGKSTLLNQVLGREAMKTGKHTTRHSELVRVEHGFLVDTPGFSSLEIDFIPKDELKYLFPEFEPYEHDCKFNNCMHNKEPGCLVKAALQEGKIVEDRYNFYIKTLNDLTNRGNKK